MNSSQHIRIGQISYANVLPAFRFFPKKIPDVHVEWVSMVPADINDALVSGEIDITPISSFAYGKHHDQLLLLPDLSVSTFGEVQSILLFHRLPIEQLHDKKVALTSTSATSVHLLKILFEKFLEIRPHYSVVEPNLQSMIADADAALLIGDDAIRASWEMEHRSDWMMTDLGQLWKDCTQSWMSYAVWAVRKPFVEKHPHLVQLVLDGFLQSKRKSLQQLDALGREASEKYGGTPSYWHQYFSNLCYDFDDRQKEGLSLYFQYAHELGYFDTAVQIKTWFNG